MSISVNGTLRVPSGERNAWIFGGPCPATARFSHLSPSRAWPTSGRRDRASWPWSASRSPTSCGGRRRTGLCPPPTPC
jgi:hypothetical protein